MELPIVNQQIKKIIDSQFNGSVRKFSIEIGINPYQKINRLFLVDKRTGKYPRPSIEILTQVSNRFDISIEKLQTGLDDLKKDDYEVKFNMTSDFIQYLKEKDAKIEELIRENSRLETELRLSKKTDVRQEDNAEVADVG